MKKDLLSIKDLTPSEILEIFETAAGLKKKPLSEKKALEGKTIALVFQKPSNRTRVSFSVGIYQLGGHSIYLGPDELKLGVRESVKDVAKVLSRYLDGIVVRTFAHEDAEKMARFSSVPVINGLSSLFHPCQGLADLFTIEEKFGKKKIKIAYVGDGNNVLHTLLLGCAMLGRDLAAATPEKYGPDPAILKEARVIAKSTGSIIDVGSLPAACVKGADVIYTDVWVSMGEESKREEKIKAFQGFQVNEGLLSGAKRDVLVMHCLPAHRGEEITDEVIDGKSSIVYDQAENRLHVQKAILLSLLTKSV